MEAKPVVLKGETSSSSTFPKIPFNIKTYGILGVVLVLVVGVGTGVYLLQSPLQLEPKAESSGVEINLNPVSSKALVGDDVEIDAQIDTRDLSVSAVELAVSYDNQAINLISFINGSFLETTSGPAKFEDGKASLNLFISPDKAKKGKGSLAKLKFKATKATTTAAEIIVDKAKTKIIAAEVSTNQLGNSRGATISISEASATALLVASASPSPSSQPTNYDFNGDSKVNSVDLSFVYASWGTPKTDNSKKADLNGDGVVNGIDYSLFLPHFKP